MKREMIPDRRDPHEEGLLLSVERLTCPDEQKDLLRRLIRSDRGCDVVRSDGQQDRGKILEIGQDGRLSIAVKDESGRMLIKRPRIETFMGWQKASKHCDNTK